MSSLICGIDEAGRGPLIGPLVLAGVAVSEDKLSELDKLGVKDSKLLLPEKRKEIYEKIINIVDSYYIIKVSPSEIDQRNAVGTNLNRLEALKAAEIISILNPDQVILDSPEPTAEKFGRMVRSILDNREIDIIAEHKADVNYKVVAAASVLAKVTRDRAIREIQKLCEQDFGSGYPSDPICQKFIETADLKQIDEHIRKCWITYQVAKEKKEQTSLDKF